jgi:hypothetical protein
MRAELRQTLKQAEILQKNNESMSESNEGDEGDEGDEEDTDAADEGDEEEC